MIDLNIYFNERLFRYLSQTISVKLFLIWRIVELAMKVLVTLMQHTKQKKTFLTAIPTLSIGRAFSCCSKLLFLIWIWTIIFLFYFNCSIPSKYLEFYIISSLEYYLIEFRFARLRYVKVHIFWDGHKFLWNLHRRFVLCSNCQMYGGDFATFCGLLRIYDLYLPRTDLSFDRCNWFLNNLKVLE